MDNVVSAAAATAVVVVVVIWLLWIGEREVRMSMFLRFSWLKSIRRKTPIERRRGKGERGWERISHTMVCQLCAEAIVAHLSIIHFQISHWKIFNWASEKNGKRERSKKARRIPFVFVSLWLRWCTINRDCLIFFSFFFFFVLERTNERAFLLSAWGREQRRDFLNGNICS